MNNRDARAIRCCRLLWAAVVLLAAVLLLSQLRSGLHIDTRFTAMVPVASEDLDSVQALAATRDQADQGIILLLESENRAQLEKAGVAISARIRTHPDLLTVSSNSALPESARKLLISHHFQLLSDRHRQQLQTFDLDSLLQDTISNLYSATGEFRLLEFDTDPFNTLGAFVEELITDNAVPISSGQQVINLVLREASREHRAEQTLNTLFADIALLVDSSYPDVRFARSGVFFFAQHAATEAKKDINLISTGSMLGLLILLVLVFRSVWPLLIPIASILTGVVSAFAVVHAVYGSIHVFTIVFGASLIGIVIDYSIHYFFHVANVRQSAGSDESLTPLLRALLVSLVTSVVGYSALALAGVELLEKIALFSVCGVVASWLTVLSLAPLVSPQTRLADPVLLQLVYRAVDWLGTKLSRLLKPVMLVPALLAMLLLVVLLAEGQDDPRKFISLPESLLAESREVATAFQGIEPGKFLLARGSDEQAIYDVLSRFYQMTDEDDDLVSVLDWLPSPRQQQENYLMAASLYQRDGLVAQLFETLGMDTSAAATLAAQYRNSQHEALSAEALFASAPGSMPSLIQKSTQGYFAPVFLTSGVNTAQLKSVAGKLKGIDYIDSVADSMAELKTQREASVIMLVLAYVVVGGLLLLLYRRTSSLTLLLVPGCATLATVCILVIAGVPFTLFHTMALFLILGLGMDYAVFLAEMSADRRITLQAILLSALTSMLSFGLLSLSSVPVAQAFGLTVFIGNTLNLIMAFALVDTLSVASAGDRAGDTGVRCRSLDDGA